VKAKFLLCRSAITKIFAAATVIIVVVGIAGAAYYLTLPAPSPSPSLTPTPIPLPRPTPFLPPTPLPTPPPIIEVKVASLEGFSYTEIGGYAEPEKLPVLHQGTSANITLNVYSHYSENRNVSLSFIRSWGESLEGVNYKFYPSTLELQPEEMATSTLTLNADSDAPSNLVYPLYLVIQVEGFPETYGQYLGFDILVFPATLSYIFLVYAEESPTPTQPPLEPEIQIKRGGEAHVIFDILTDIENPSHKLSLTYHSGELPEGINANITPGILTVKSLLLTLTANPHTPEETYEITANGSVDSITYERKFHLKVTT